MDYQPITDYFKNLRRVIRKFHDLSTEELQEILQADPSLYPVVIDLYALDIKLRHGIFDQHIHWKVLFPKPLSSYFPEEGFLNKNKLPDRISPLSPLAAPVKFSHSLMLTPVRVRKLPGRRRTFWGGECNIGSGSSKCSAKSSSLK